ncbi:RusA family crossover junction endodeoxyribonuclease [Clostridium isatidis]|uniref:Crossover junction endodeoxyribonuclease RuvA n=1 Tax=Clostridium isatidis TaxID=182773 RepID=A0A343JEZ3_9CLOT|nr:RusA family crossover junction endodeoxyribonuclease [Clostridium isatidis]ASW44101.1 crossover junction endodeoxyribonuclease RuvA [Clostridium isatidis]
MNIYAKVIVPGSPISKSNFKLHNKDGRAILPYNTGKSYDKYALYEEEIAYHARLQNPNVVLEEALIAVLKVYYKSEKRHPDTANITKSIFDGVEKSGLIVNDAQITKIITEEYYDKVNPRFELEFFAESEFTLSYSIIKKDIPSDKKIYTSLKKNIKNKINSSAKKIPKKKADSEDLNIGSKNNTCHFCQKEFSKEDLLSADNGKTIFCRNCFRRMF